MRKEEYLMLLEELTKKTETFLPGLSTEKSTNNGTSSTLMNGRESQLRVNSMKTSVCMLKETSMLFLNCQTTDTLTSVTTGI